jgi:flagellum-specific peptidoglycan hydrolase FlgJ
MRPGLISPGNALESGWGEHQPGNNPFGIMVRPGEPFTRKMTQEFIRGAIEFVAQDFAAYPNLDAAFTRHAQTVTSGPYRAAWEAIILADDLPELLFQFRDRPGYVVEPDAGW